MDDAAIAGVDMRTKFKIIVDILEIAKNGANKTGIVYRTNLNFRIADKYLDLLLKRGFMGEQVRFIYHQKTRD